MLIGIDFEYKRPSEPDMGLVCVALAFEDGTESTYDLANEHTKHIFKVCMLGVKGSTFVGFFIELAECRCLAAMGINPLDYKWRDLSIEWKWLRNGDERFKYGRWIKKYSGYPMFGTSVPPIAFARKDDSKEVRWDVMQANKEHAEAEGATNTEEVGQGLLDLFWFFEILTQQDLIDDWKVKEEMHDLLINGSWPEIMAQIDKVKNYCLSDAVPLITAAHVITKKMQEVLDEQAIVVNPSDNDSLFDCSGSDLFTVEEIQLNMGRWAAHLGVIGNRGIPLSGKRLGQMKRAAPLILETLKDQWQREHWDEPIYRIGSKKASDLLKLKNSLKISPYKDKSYYKDTEMTQAWLSDYIKSNNLENKWSRNENGTWSLSSKVLKNFEFGDNIIKQYTRHNNSVSAIRGWNPEKKDGIWKHIGSDNCNRPTYVPFGTQTARNAHKSSTYLFAGPHWTRVLVEPVQGECIVSLDYSSQEVFIAAVLSGDKALEAVYMSNDPYWMYATQTGAIPDLGRIPTEEERDHAPFAQYKEIRAVYKALFLAIGFGAQAESIANTVRSVIKDKEIYKEDGQRWLDEYEETYWKYIEFRDNLKADYDHGNQIILQNGWRMGPDNRSTLSMLNLPVQGFGSAILQRAVDIMHSWGLNIVATMHDDITFKCLESEVDQAAGIAKKFMLQAAEEVLGRPGMKVGNPEIVRHGDTWIHGRGAKDWNLFKQYFEEE